MKKYKSKPKPSKHYQPHQSQPSKITNESDDPKSKPKPSNNQQSSLVTKLSDPTIKSVLKYVYIVAFFLLLSGFFYPLIHDTSFDKLVGGTFVLLIGLVGGILLYKATISKNNQMFFLAAGGFALMIVSLFFIFKYTARFGPL